ncbi:unnamed protein product [Didymodactylos carnosus]|uniref:Uncharacterized protein n=1 Tax=Didymodactylos carnosus TaxID=1234261 RepID=A0A8S2KYK9_9BILA|nr:unnamed protein product [Didymodactylos carnosus]CAF3875686.1 unnamed protein product [Didymodactylos carnosus]
MQPHHSWPLEHQQPAKQHEQNKAQMKQHQPVGCDSVQHVVSLTCLRMALSYAARALTRQCENQRIRRASVRCAWPDTATCRPVRRSAADHSRRRPV